MKLVLVLLHPDVSVASSRQAPATAVTRTDRRIRRLALTGALRNGAGSALSIAILPSVLRSTVPSTLCQ
jgi:hypothetical protein